MFRPRIIPVLLMKDGDLVKSKRFKNYRYIGDPINAIKLFNDLKVDELVLLDIDASIEKRLIDINFVKKLGEETNMPFSVGGGIRTLDDIQRILAAGAEKVVINSYALINPDFIKEAAENFGSSSIVVCIDIKNRLFSSPRVCAYNGKKNYPYTPSDFARLMENNGAGEVIIQSIQNDGMMSGYDLDLIKEISSILTIPVIPLGGAGNSEHLIEAVEKGFASAVAAGSLFVFHGKDSGVLINYPEKIDFVF